MVPQRTLLSKQSHLRSRIDARAPSLEKTAVHLNASASINSDPPNNKQFSTLDSKKDVIYREYNSLPSFIGWDGSFLYPRENGINFTPNRNSRLPTSIDRAIREVPQENKYDIISDRILRPEFTNECVGTPRREYQGGMVNGIRIRAVANPYFKAFGQKRKQFDRWRSRDWQNWDPFKTSVRGGTKLYNVPDDIVPKKDELGEWKEPCLSGRYQADIERQYVMNGLPWIYRRDFLENKMHILDKEPVGPKRWYKREYRQAKIREAMRNMDQLVEDYRKERKEAKKKTWFEQIIQKLVGTQMSSKYITERKVVKI
jgi:hypothetical protein